MFEREEDESRVWKNPRVSSSSSCSEEDCKGERGGSKFSSWRILDSCSRPLRFSVFLEKLEEESEALVHTETEEIDLVDPDESDDDVNVAAVADRERRRRLD